MIHSSWGVSCGALAHTAATMIVANRQPPGKSGLAGCDGR